MRTLLLLLVSTCVLAQQNSTVRATNTEYDQKTLPSMTVSIDAPVDEVYERWQDFWEDRYEIDIDRTDKDGNSIAYLAEQVRIPGMGDKGMDFYSNVDGGDQNATVSISFAYSDQDVVTSQNHPQDYQIAEGALQQFVTEFYRTYFDEQLEEVQDELTDIQDDAQDASKDAQRAREKIEKYEEKIEKLRRKIEETREEVGDELRTEEEKARRVRELEEQLQQLRTRRTNYVG